MHKQLINEAAANINACQEQLATATGRQAELLRRRIAGEAALLTGAREALAYGDATALRERCLRR